MNRIVTGLLIGVGVVTGLVVFLMQGKKTQRFLRERWQQLRRTLPEPEQVQHYAQKLANRLTHAASHEKGSERRSVKKVKVAGNMLGDLVQQTSTALKQTGQDVTKKTRQLARKEIQSY